MATKYRQYVNRMLETEKELFDRFRRIHDNYTLNPQEFQEEFNKEGERVLQIIAFWENKLCKQSEIAGYGNYTNSLSEKFRNEIKKIFPEINNIGLILESNYVQQINTVKNNIFMLKKIQLP